MMTINDFFDLFLKELDEHPAMNRYYGFDNRIELRKAEFLQRLQYVSEQIKNEKATVWDCGCGYGTTALFLAMNGFRVYGTTLEYYFDEIETRKRYWKQFGNSDLFTVDYANIFDNDMSDNSFDYIILQDTLHHIEPLDEALEIFHRIVKPDGKLIVLEENGNSIVDNNWKLYKKRGNSFKKVIRIWDERLQKHILLGNENVRSWKTWKREFKKAGFVSETRKPEYIGFLHRFFYRNLLAEEMIAKENNFTTKFWPRNYLASGINFSMKPCK